MLSKKVKSRIFFLILSFAAAAMIIFIVLRSLEENVVYFLSPTEIYNKTNITFDKTIRIGGLVKTNSISKNETSIIFIITDLKKEIINHKRNNEILRKIKEKSIINGIDPKITKRIWKAIIWSYVDYQRRNFKKK